MRASTGYFTTDGRFADTDAITVLKGTFTASANGSVIEVGQRGVARLTLNVTSASGITSTLDAKIQTRRDANDAWRDVASFAQKTGVSSERKCFVGFDREIRGVAILRGPGASFTFSIDGELV